MGVGVDVEGEVRGGSMPLGEEWMVWKKKSGSGAFGVIEKIWEL